MALVEFRSPASAFSGRTGVGKDGQVYYSLEGRGMARTLVFPNNPNTSDQQTIRALQTSLSGQFSDLTREQGDAWNAFAQNLTSKDRLGREYSYSGIQAFLAVNTHRVLAGQSAIANPPPFVNTPSPIRVVSIAHGSGETLNIVLQHLVSAGSGFWRIRLTPPLNSNVRLAAPSELRSATALFASSYAAIAVSPQTINLAPRFAYAAGNTLGVEITGFSPQYVPGQVFFNRRMAIS